MSFSYFFKIVFDYGAAHWYLFRISRIILQYSVQALSNIYDRALWQKINNNLKTAVDHCHREVGLKCGRALRSNSETHIQQKKKKKKKISKKKKHYKYVKYIQVSNKNPKTVSGASAVKFEHILHFILILLWLNLNQKMLAGFEKLWFHTIKFFLDPFIGLNVFILINPK